MQKYKLLGWNDLINPTLLTMVQNTFGVIFPTNGSKVDLIYESDADILVAVEVFYQHGLEVKDLALCWFIYEPISE
mgnify:CR=1 FL=1